MNTNGMLSSPSAITILITGVAACASLALLSASAAQGAESKIAPSDQESRGAPSIAQPVVMPTFWMPHAGSGWVDFKSAEGGQILIPVVLNGQAARALIDTGVDQMLVSKEFVATHHLAVIPGGTVGSFGGSSRYDYATDISLDVGALRTTVPGAFIVMDLSSARRGGNIDAFDVIIGLALLARLGWEIDQDHHRFRFFRSGTVPIADGIAVHIGPNKSRLLTDLQVNGKPITPTMIDTGSDDAISLPTATAREVGFKAETDIAASGLGGLAVLPLGKLSEVQIGRERLDDVYSTVGGTNWYDEAGVKAMIGMKILQDYNMIVDAGSGKMQLAERALRPPPQPKSTLGIQGIYVDGKLPIVHVMKNSPAADAGLKDGDAVCAVNGEAMSQALMDRKWARAAPGSRYQLRLCNGTSHYMTSRTFY